MKMYKIRNKASGLFSTGGTWRYKIWSKTGKMWTKRTLSLHLALVRSSPRSSPYDNDPLEIVEYNVVEVNTKPLTI